MQDDQGPVHAPEFPANVTWLQDGAPIVAEDAGADVVAGGATSIMTVDAPRLYRLVSNREIDRHELTLSTTSDGVALYAFTFTSCVVE